MRVHHYLPQHFLRYRHRILGYLVMYHLCKEILHASYRLVMRNLDVNQHQAHLMEQPLLPHLPQLQSESSQSLAHNPALELSQQIQTLMGPNLV